MHARVQVGQTKPGAMDDLQRMFTEAARAHTMQQPGYQGLLLLGDRRTGKALLITIWEAHAAILAGEESGYLQAQRDNLAHLLLGPPTIDHYEVGLEIGTLGAQAAGKPARLTSGLAQPGMMAQITRVFTDDVAPVVQAQAGFLGLLLLGNAQTNKSLALSIWHSDEAMLAGEHSGHFHEQMAKLAHMYDGPPTREHVTVLTHL